MAWVPFQWLFKKTRQKPNMRSSRGPQNQTWGHHGVHILWHEVFTGSTFSVFCISFTMASSVFSEFSVSFLWFSRFSVFGGKMTEFSMQLCVFVFVSFFVGLFCLHISIRGFIVQLPHITSARTHSTFQMRALLTIDIPSVHVHILVQTFFAHHQCLQKVWEVHLNYTICSNSSTEWFSTFALL